MDWMNQLGNIVQKYRGTGGGNDPGADHDFDQVARSAPRPVLAKGLAEAFRASSTPPFGQIVETLFTHGDPTQRSGILSILLSLLGPSGARDVARTSGAASLAGLLGWAGQITPQQASEVDPSAVRHMAEEAERRDPSVVEKISDFAAEHHGLTRTLGGSVLGSALGRLIEH